MARIEVVSFSDRDIRERTMVLAEAPVFQMGSITFQPDIMVVTWSRRSGEPWHMVAMEIGGPRVVQEDGQQVVRHHDRRKCKFARVEDAPRWALSLANSNIPARF